MTHVRIWEASWQDGRAKEAVAWVQQVAAPDALEAGALTAEVFHSDDQVVLLSRWVRPTSWVEPAPDSALLQAHGVRPFRSVGDR